MVKSGIVVPLTILFLSSTVFGCESQPAPEPTCFTKADVVFVRDDSGSINSNDFELLKGFYRNLVSLYKINPNAVQVGFVWFSTSSGVDANLNDYTDASSLERKIDSLGRPQRGITCIACGIREATEIGGLRENGVNKVMVVLTDGGENSGSAENEAVIARNKGWRIIMVGVGSFSTSTKNMMQRVSDGDLLFASDFSNLGGLRLPEIGEEFCTMTCGTPCILNSNSEADCTNTVAGYPCALSGTKRSVKCVDGYALDPAKPVTPFCKADGTWDKNMPECIKAVVCDAPDIQFSVNGVDCGNTKGGEICDLNGRGIIECVENYELDPTLPAIPTCGEDGEWEKLPECIEVLKCGAPEIAFSDSNVDCIGTLPNNLCHLPNGVQCQEGYERKEESPVLPFCQADGTWFSMLPECVEILHCDPPLIPDADEEMAIICDGTYAGEICDLPGNKIIQCKQGFDLDPSKPAIPYCLPEGVWAMLPACIPVVTCPALFIENGSPETICEGTYANVPCALDDTGTVQCRDEYILNPDKPSVPFCEDDGTWLEEEVPECVEIVTCPALSIANGSPEIICEGTFPNVPCTLDDTGTVQCRDGYSLNPLKPSVPFCQDDGTWFEDAVPECVKIVTCPALVIENGSPETICEGTFPNVPCALNDTGTVQCKHGYSLNPLKPSVPFCQDDGTWLEEAVPECVEIPKCDVPDVENSNAETSCGNTFAGESCLFVCDSGFKLQFGAGQMICDEYGEWQYTPSCKPSEFAIVLPSMDAEKVEKHVQLNDKFWTEYTLNVCKLFYAAPPAGQYWECVDAIVSQGQSDLYPYNFDAKPYSEFESERQSQQNPSNDASPPPQTSPPDQSGPQDEEQDEEQNEEQDEEQNEEQNETGGTPTNAPTQPPTQPPTQSPTEQLTVLCEDDTQNYDDCNECAYYTSMSQGCVGWDFGMVPKKEDYCAKETPRDDDFGTLISDVCPKFCGTCDKKLKLLEHSCEDDTQNYDDCNECGYFTSVSEGCVGWDIAFFPKKEHYCARQTPREDDFATLISDVCPKFCGTCHKKLKLLEEDDSSKLFTPLTKINRLDKQPHSPEGKSFFDMYKDMVDFALFEPPLSLADNETIVALEAEKERIAIELDDDLVYWEKKFLDRCKTSLQYTCDLESQQDYFDYVGFDPSSAQFRQDLIESQLDQIQDNPVFRLRKKLEGAEDTEQYGIDTIDTSSWVKAVKPNWEATPSSREIVNSPTDVAETGYGFKINTTSTRESDITVVATGGLVAEHNGQYSRIMFSEESFQMEFSMTIRKAAKVDVRPGGWYSDTWDNVARDDEYRSDTSLDEIYGDKGYMNSIIRTLHVVQDMEINFHMAANLSEFDKWIWSNATSISTPFFCEGTGAACGPGLNNVFIGSNAPENGGVDANNELTGGWKYMELLLQHFDDIHGSNTDDTTNPLSGIVSLGATKPNSTISELLSGHNVINNNHPGHAIYRSALAVSSTELPAGNILWKDGEDEVTNFLVTLAQNQKYLIYIPGTGDFGLDNEERNAITHNAAVLETHVKAGGALMVFASEQDDYLWMTQLIDNLQYTNICGEENGLVLIDQADERLPGISQEIMDATLPCVAAFDIDPLKKFGNLDTFATDSKNRPYIMTAYKSIKEVSANEQLTGGAKMDDVTVNGTGLYLTFKITEPDTPQVFLTHAPRFYESESDIPRYEGRSLPQESDENSQSHFAKIHVFVPGVLAIGAVLVIFVMKRVKRRSSYTVI